MKKPNRKIILNIDELALFLNIDKLKINYWVTHDHLPCYRIGEMLRFDKETVIEWLDKDGKI